MCKIQRKEKRDRLNRVEDQQGKRRERGAHQQDLGGYGNGA